MTREEAITRIQDHRKMVLSPFEEKTEEAFDLAIEALEAADSTPTQPEKCLVYRDGGLCGYPIWGCCECPRHEYTREVLKTRKAMRTDGAILTGVTYSADEFLVIEKADRNGKLEWFRIERKE